MKNPNQQPANNNSLEWQNLAEKPKMTFSAVGEAEMPVIADLEKRLYSEETIQYDDQDYLQELLDEPESEKYSFIINSESGWQQEPIGYCLAYEAKPMLDSQSTVKTVYVADFGIVPEARAGIEPALNAFQELLKRTEENGVRQIEMEARKDTSYKLLTSRIVQRFLARIGYSVIDHGVSDDEWSDGDVTYLLDIIKNQK